MSSHQDTPSSFEEDDNVVKFNKPKPTNFDAFLPWACKAMAVNTDVVVTKAAQSE